MVSIRHEIAEVEAGKAPRDNNVLVHAPHTAQVRPGDQTRTCVC
jgi:glycine dehydrogenase